MNTPLRGVRPGDAVLAVLLTALGVVLMVADIGTTSTAAVPQDSHSWLVVPVFALATVPVLWRRRSPLGVIALSTAAIAVHVVAFGWTTRCGAGLPLAFALAYAAGRLSPRVQALVGLLGVAVLQVLVLVQDSSAGLGVLPATVVVSAAFWGVGVWLRSRAGRSVGSDGSDVPTPVGAAV